VAGWLNSMGSLTEVTEATEEDGFWSKANILSLSFSVISVCSSESLLLRDERVRGCLSRLGAVRLELWPDGLKAWGFLTEVTEVTEKIGFGVDQIPDLVLLCALCVL